MVEQLLLQPEHQSLQKEEEQLAQLQVALHKLERAKLEVAVYTEAITKALRQWDHSAGETTIYTQRAFRHE
jgi:hypothetical protein